MKKVFAVFCLGFLFLVNSSLAVEFDQIELVSISRIDSWNLVSDVWLETNTIERMVNVVANGVSHDMPLTTVWNTWDFYLSNNITPINQTPADFIGKTFIWTAVDNGTVPAEEISATGTVSGIRQVPLSTNLTITGDPLQPTISWSNSHANIDAFRIRLYERQADGSLFLLKQSDDMQKMSYTVPDEARLEYGKTTLSVLKHGIMNISI